MSTYFDRYKERKRVDSAQGQPSDSLQEQIDLINTKLRTYDNFEKQFDDIRWQVASLEDKVVNCTRLIKLQQNYAEQQDDELSSVKQQLTHRSEEGFNSERKDHDLVSFVKNAQDYMEGEIRRLENQLVTGSTSRYDFSKFTNLENELQTQLSTIDDLQQHIKRYSERLILTEDKAVNAEETCARLADDCLARVQDVMKQTYDLEKHTNDLERLTIATAEEVRNHDKQEGSLTVERHVRKLEEKLEHYISTISTYEDHKLSVDELEGATSLRASLEATQTNKPNLRFSGRSSGTSPEKVNTETPHFVAKSKSRTRKRMRRAKSDNTIRTKSPATIKSQRSKSPSTIKSRAKDLAIQKQLKQKQLADKKEATVTVKIQKAQKQRNQQSRRSRLEQIYQEMSLKASRG